MSEKNEKEYTIAGRKFKMSDFPDYVGGMPPDPAVIHDIDYLDEIEKIWGRKWILPSKKGFEMRKRWWEVKVFKEAKHKVFDYKVKIIEVSMFAGTWMFRTDCGTFAEYELTDFS